LISKINTEQSLIMQHKFYFQSKTQSTRFK